MASRGKKNRKQAKPGPGANRPPVGDAFDLDAPGPLVTGNDGAPKQLPTLMQAVAKMQFLHHRRDIVANLIQKYNCSARTIDRALAAIRDERLAYMKQDREERIAEGVDFFKAISQTALAAGKYQAARASRRDLHALAGDLKPETVYIVGADRPADELIARADELRKKREQARKP